MARAYGVPDFPYVLVPHPVASLSALEIRQRAEDVVPRVLQILGVEE